MAQPRAAQYNNALTLLKLWLVVLDGQDQLFPVVTVKRLRVLRR